MSDPFSSKVIGKRKHKSGESGVPSPLGVVGDGTDVHLTMGFHSPSLERPQDKLVANLLLIPRVLFAVSRVNAVPSTLGLSEAPQAWR